MKPQDKLNEITAKLIEKIENNETTKWFKSWSVGLPKNHTTNSFYSGFNVLSLMNEMDEKGYKVNQWLTYNQIIKMGATLKKGSKGTPVFFFKPLEVEEINDNGEMELKTIPMLKIFTVFNICQTDIEINTINEEKEDVNLFVSNTGAIIKTKTEAFYSPSNDFIGMPDLSTFKDTEHYTATLLHELSHWTGAEHRLNRNLTGKFGTEDYAKEELIAELSAAMLCSFFGIEGDMRHAEYLQSWLKSLKAEPKLLWKSASEAQKIFDFLMEFQTAEAVA